MIRKSPFHERTNALNETGLWTHWSGYLAADRYQMSDKFEYFAVRNAAGVFDSSPLYKYRIAGKDAETFLAGMLARDIRACPPGHAQYTTWLDDRGFVIEDGVILRKGKDEYLLTSAEPNFAWFADRIGRLDVTIEEQSEDIGTLALQGPRSRALLAKLVPQMEKIPYFGLATGEIGGAAVTVSRTGYSGDLGYEIWVDQPDALHVWDTLWDSMEGHGVLPFGLAALYMLRIEAGLLLLDADFDSSRFAWNDAHRSTPIELGWGWMFKDLARRRSPVHRPSRPRARDRRQDVALGDARPHRRLARLRSGLQRGRAHPAQGPHAGPGGLDVLRRRLRTGRVRHELHVLPDAPAPHRDRPDPTGPREARDEGEPRVHRRPPLRAGRRACRPAAPLQPRAKDGLT